MRDNVLSLRKQNIKRMGIADGSREARDGVRELHPDQHTAWAAEKFRDAIRIFRTIFGSDLLIKALILATTEEKMLVELDKTRVISR